LNEFFVCFFIVLGLLSSFSILIWRDEKTTKDEFRKLKTAQSEARKRQPRSVASPHKTHKRPEEKKKNRRRGEVPFAESSKEEVVWK